jgi:cell division protein FtsI/penicillin-binding protein 2
MKINKTNFKIFFIAIHILLTIIVIRLMYLQIYRHDFFKNKLDDQLKRIVKLYPNRGNIFDRNKKPLALTSTSYSIYATPYQIKDKFIFSKEIAYILKTHPKKIFKIISSKSPFVWVKRKVSPEIKKQLEELKLVGINYIKVEKRVYPNKSLGADILGFVGIDNQGLSGLEYQHDHLLKGSPGKLIIEGDPRGFRLMTGSRKEILPNNGGHIETTIDEYIQYSTQKHLAHGVSLNRAIKGHAIVMKPKTGEIIAMTDYPDFDANNWRLYKSKILKNSCITDVFEPGSIFKIITLAAVLEEKLFQPESSLYIPEKIYLAGHTIREAHKRKEGESATKTVAQIIQESLNVGTTLLAQKLGKVKFYKYMQAFGFGTPTEIDLPGESAGILKPPKNWSGVDIAMHSFGQGLAATTIQMACAVSAVANGGLLLKPRIIKSMSQENGKIVKSPPKQIKRRIISKVNAKKIIDILTVAVEKGTGTTAKVPGFKVAGKTGTAQKAKENGLGYEPGKYIASFIGFFPAEDPEYLIIIAVDSPERYIYGSQVAAPIFKNIAKDIVNYKNLKPTVYK